MRNSDSTHHSIEVGENVAFTESFVDRNRRYANSMPSARGKVTAIHYLDKVTLADIEWDKPGLPKRVNVKNLALCEDVPLGA